MSRSLVPGMTYDPFPPTNNCKSSVMTHIGMKVCEKFNFEANV